MQFFLDNLLKNPPLLLGLISMIGLLLQRKNISDVIKGAFLAAFGMLILTEGVNMLISSIAPINRIVQTEIGASVSEGLSDVTFTGEYGGVIGISMFVGLVLHLLIARFTPIKTIFLTGHMLWWFPFVVVAAGVESNLSKTALIVLGAVLSALYWSIMPWIMRRFVWDVTGDESFLIGHPTGILSIVSGYIARIFGNKEKSTENLKLSKNLSFFKEISITGAIMMFIIYIVAGIFSNEFVPQEQTLIIYALNSALKFGVGLLVMLYGVRLLINQIIPAFEGIAQKVVPGAKPAFDVPLLFGYKPNAVIIGFMVAMVVSTILVILANITNVFGVILVPLIITSFFECGGAAVIGEGQGGLRGAVIGTCVSAILMVALVGVSAVIYKTTIENWIIVFGGNDLSLMGILGNLISKLLGVF